MDTKISSEFWSDKAIEPLTADTKLAALWLLTNSSVNVAGYAEITEKRFCFETGLTPEALAKTFEALPKLFVRTPEGYWIPAYIKRQIGTGGALVKNNWSKPLLRALKDYVSPSIRTKVLERYEELIEPFEKMREGRASDGVGSTSKAKLGKVRLGKDKTPGDPQPRRRSTKEGAQLPDQLPEPLRSRMLQVGALLHRQPSTPWTIGEQEAFCAQKLDAIPGEVFADQVGQMGVYYGADIPREKNYRRRELLTLLNHWPGELDKAALWARENQGTGGLKPL
jgi:hypothetical protein